MNTNLNELIEKLESGSRPKGGVKNGIDGVPSLGAEHLNSIGGFNFSKIKYVPNDFFDNQKKGVISKDDILVVKDGATTGKVSFVGNEFPFDEASINEHLFKLTIRAEKALPKYVHWYLFSDKGKRQILKDFRGATVGGISRNFINNIQIPLPSIDDQGRIVKLLDISDSVRKKRREVIKLLDDYLNSVFIDMFGDPVHNPKQWQKVPLADILSKIESGHSPVCLDRPAKQGEWAVLKLGAVTKCVYKPSENKALTDIEKPNLNIEIKKGDILFSRKNTPELVAACAYVWETPPKLMMPDLIFRLVPKDDKLVNPLYLQALLTFPPRRKIIQRLANGAAGSMPNISKSKLLEHRIELPPIALQNQFAEVVKKAESIKKSMNSQSKELDNQFQSLIQKVFNDSSQLVSGL